MNIFLVHRLLKHYYWIVTVSPENTESCYGQGTVGSPDHLDILNNVQSKADVKTEHRALLKEGQEYLSGFPCKQVLKLLLKKVHIQT